MAIHSIHLIFQLGFALFLSTLGFNVEAKIIADSGFKRLQMIELFSSESCSSCPPADLWISQLKEDSNLWKTFVPVVFHVDYWNHLNWKDEFSSEPMTQRQISLSKLWMNPSVYTPGFVINGKEWKDWRSSKKLSLVPEAKDYGLRITIDKKSKDDYRVSFSGYDKNKKYVLRYAFLGMNIDSKVAAGENSGKLLMHNFIVLKWDEIKAKELSQITLTIKSDDKKTSLYKAIVVWVEAENNPEPLQVAGGYI